MKKAVLFVLVTLVFNSACEKDDFCLQNPVTPKLVITFFDDANRLIPKKAQRLSVWAENKDTIAEYASVNKDSIAIPLNSLATETIYKLKINNEDGSMAKNTTATFTIQYTPTNDYVSRSCGYRVVFNNATFSADNTWIKAITTTSTTTNIDNQNAAHVQIFH